MINLRETASQVDWQLAHADATAIAQRQIALGQLPAARQDNLQRARDVMTKLAQDESYYRAQTLNRLGTYEKLKTDYVEYIKTRDEAARQGKIGSVGLGVFYAVDMVGNGLAAAGMPIAKFYTVVRNVGDKSVAAYDTLRPYFSSPAAPASPAGGRAANGAIPDMGYRMAHGLPATAAQPGAKSQEVTPSAPPRTSDENTRAVTAPLEAVRELHKAAEETLKLDQAYPGSDRYRHRQWTRRHTAETDSKPEPFTVSKGAGQIADTTLKTINSIADLSAAQRSGDAARIYDAQSQALRDGLKSGSTLIEVWQKDRKLRGERGASGEFPVPAQVMKAFQTGEKLVVGTQSVAKGLDAYYEARDGNYDKAWEHARDGATHAAKTFTKFGEQTEAGGKAVDALIRYGKATSAADGKPVDTRQAVTSLMEFAGQATKVGGVVPGASEAGEAILKAKDVVDQGYNFKEAIDLGNRDEFKPNLDRLGDQILGDYEMYIRLNEFRQVFNLPAGKPAAVLPPTAQ